MRRTPRAYFVSAALCIITAPQMGCESKEKKKVSSPDSHTPSAVVTPPVKLPPSPAARTPRSPLLALKGITPTPGASLTIGETEIKLDAVGRQQCRLGDAIQTIVKPAQGPPEVRTFIVHAPTSRAEATRRMTITAGTREHTATLAIKDAITSLSFDGATLRFGKTHDWLLPDEQLGKAGCFHTGTFALTTPPLTGPMTGVHNHTTESYSFHAELTEEHAISVIVFLPDLRFATERPMSADLAEVFKNPRDAVVRVFFEQRTMRQDTQGVEHYTWTQLPAEDGTLSVTFSGELQRSSAHIKLANMTPPKAWTYPIAQGATLGLTAHTSIITDPRGKLIPPLRALDDAKKP
jgi:hypothetical protein